MSNLNPPERERHNWPVAAVIVLFVASFIVLFITKSWLAVPAFVLLGGLVHYLVFIQRERWHTS